MIGVHLPLPEPYVIGRSARSTICHRCWSLHADITLLYADRVIGWSCANNEEAAAYASFFRSSVANPVLAANHIPAAVREWLDSKPSDLTREESAAMLLYKMGAIPPDTVKWLDVRPRPAPIGEPGERVEAVVTCVSVIEQPATEWGQSFMITFESDGRTVIWRTGVGGLDAQPGGTYRVKMSVKSHERFGGKPVTYVQRVKEVSDGE